MKTKELGAPEEGRKHPQGQSEGRDEGGGKRARGSHRRLRKTQLCPRCFSCPFVLLFPLSYHIHASSGKRQRGERRQDS